VRRKGGKEMIEGMKEGGGEEEGSNKKTAVKKRK